MVAGTLASASATTAGKRAVSKIAGDALIKFFQNIAILFH